MGEREGEGAGDGFDLVGGLVNELEAEVADARGKPRVEMRRSVLGLGAEDGVAAADIGDEGMAAALFVFE